MATDSSPTVRRTVEKLPQRRSHGYRALRTLAASLWSSRYRRAFRCLARAPAFTPDPCAPVRSGRALPASWALSPKCPRGSLPFIASSPTAALWPRTAPTRVTAWRSRWPALVATVAIGAGLERCFFLPNYCSLRSVTTTYPAADPTDPIAIVPQNLELKMSQNAASGPSERPGPTSPWALAGSEPSLRASAASATARSQYPTATRVHPEPRWAPVPAAPFASDSPNYDCQRP